MKIDLSMIFGGSHIENEIFGGGEMALVEIYPTHFRLHPATRRCSTKLPSVHDYVKILSLVQHKSFEIDV